MSHRRLIGLLLLALLCAVPATFAQGGDPPGQINAALQDLASRLGRTVALTDTDSWNYTSDFYTNSSLGCPLATGTEIPQGVTGFTFTIALDGVTYEYRVSGDSSIVIPCSQNLLETAPLPTGEVTPGDLTPVVTGEACPQGFVGLLTPRVTANSRAEITGGAPIRLRSGAGLSVTQLALIIPGTVIDVIGGPICADQYVWWQVSASGQGGWVAEGALPDVYFIAPVAAAATVTPQATAVATLTPVPATVGTSTPVPQRGETVVVETGNLPELAAVVDNTTLTTFDITSPDALTPVSQVTAFSPEFGPAVLDLAWSPDGRYLVYTIQGEGDNYELYLTDVAGSAPRLLSDDLYYPMPVTFSPAGTQVYFARPGTDAAPTENGVTVNVFAQDVAAESQAELVGTFMFGVGCGGGSPYPGDAVYSWEAGYMGRGSVFEMTPYGLVYSVNCSGSGTALLDLQTGVSTELGANLSRVAASPDGERLVAVQDSADGSPVGGVLTVIDLATLTLTPLGTVAEPDQVAWGGANVIYYSTRAEGGLVVPGSDNDTFANDFGIPDGVPSFDLTVHRVDLTQTTDAEIWSGAGWAVPRLYASPDGDALFFNLIPAGEDWVDAVNAGTLTNQDNAESFYFPVLYRLGLTTGEAVQVAENLVMPAFNSAAFAAPAASTEPTAG